MLIPYLLPLVGATSLTAEKVVDSVSQGLCDQYSQITPVPGQYTFSSNQWGEDGSGGQCIYIDTNNAYTATWQWSRNSALVHSYPNVGLNKSTLPIQLSSLTALNLSTRWLMQPSHSSSNTSDNTHDDLDISGLASLNAKSNVALDMFFDADTQRAQSTTAAAYEVMIWLGAIGSATPFNGDANSADHHTYNLIGSTFTLFVGHNLANQTVLTWLAGSNITSLGQANFSPLLLYLQQHNLLPPDVYLGVLQFGSETYHATDQVRFQIATGFEMDVSSNSTSGNDTSTSGKKANGASGHNTWQGIQWLGLILTTILLI